MVKSLTDTISYEWNYNQRSDVVTVSIDQEFNSVSIGKHSEASVEFNKETIPHLIKMLEEIIK
jgi:hypothetical protein